MNRIVSLLAVVSVSLLAACGGDSKLPNPTGKAAIRAINAIERSPSINFLIEERSIDGVAYKSVSSPASYDDLDYTFNFDVQFAGASERTRIASQHIDVLADQDYTLLVSGTLGNAQVTIWEAAERTFQTNDTVFQTRFANTANSIGSIDFYFAADGVVPVLGEQVATLSFGQIAEPADFEEGEYVLTITAAGDPTTVLFQADPITFPSQANRIITPFDGNENDLAPYVVINLGVAGNVQALTDSSYPAVVQFVHVATDLGSSDIYDDEALTSQILGGHNYGEVSAEIPINTGEKTFRYTPAGSTASITLEGSLTGLPGLRYRIVALGSDSAYTTSVQRPDRSALDTAVSLNIISTSNNFEFLDVFAVPTGEPLDGATPILARLPRSAPSGTLMLEPGGLDFYVRSFGEEAVLAGPLQKDAQLGDVIDLIIFDDTDPAIVQILDLSVTN